MDTLCSFPAVYAVDDPQNCVSLILDVRASPTLQMSPLVTQPSPTPSFSLPFPLPSPTPSLSLLPPLPSPLFLPFPLPFFSSLLSPFQHKFTDEIVHAMSYMQIQQKRQLTGMEEFW